MVRLTIVTSFVLLVGVSLEEAAGGPADWWVVSEVCATLLYDYDTNSPSFSVLKY